MKKLLFILLALTFSSLQQPLKCQEYQHFPSNSAKWSVYSRLSPWGETTENTFFYFINGDTLFDTTLYQKIYRFTAYYYYNDVIDTAQSQYIGGLREDTNKHIFFKPMEINQVFSNNAHIENSTLNEFLLYRFDLEIGDEFYLNEYIPNPYSVYEIDSVLVDSSYRKRFHIMYDAGDSRWIEGIGSDLSLFGSLFFSFEGQELLLCYEDQTTLYYGEWNYFGRCTHFLVGYDEYPASTFQIYPNPANKEIFIKGINKEQIYSIAIYNQLGKKALEVTGIPDKIDVSILKSGIYIVSLATNHNTIRKKILIGK